MPVEFDHTHRTVKKIVRESCIIGWYTLIFCVLTYPLVFHFSTHIVGEYNSDAPLFIWNAWHMMHQMAVGHLSFDTQSILYPHVTSLALHTYTPVYSLCALLVTLFTHQRVLSFNLIFLFFSVLSAYTAYHFFYLSTRSRFASLLGGQLFAFQSLWSVYVSFGTQNILTQWCIPATLLAYELSVRRKKPWLRVVCGALLSLALYNDAYEFMFAFTALLCWVVAQSIMQKNFKQHAQHFAFVLCTFVVLSVPAIFHAIQAAPFIRTIALPTISDVQYYAADPINLIRPYAGHPLLGKFANAFTPHALQNGNAFVGITSFFFFAILIVLLLKKSRRNAFVEQKEIVLFAGIGSVFLLFAFGPFLQVAGLNTHIPMPYWFVHLLLPQFFVLRVPLRWLIPAFFFFAGALALCVAFVEKHIRRAYFFVAFCAVLFVGYCVDMSFIPRPLMTVYGEETTAYAYIHDSTVEGSVLELPASVDSGYWSVGDIQQHVPMLHQIVHERPIVTGHLSRLPQEYQTEYEHSPVISYLVHFQTALPNDDDVKPEHIQEYLRRTNLAFITIDLATVDRDAATFKTLLAYIEDSLRFHIVREDDYTLVFEKAADEAAL